MTQVKLKEEQELWEPEEEGHSLIKKFKEEPGLKSAHTSEDARPILNVKEEPEEVRIKPESHEDCPYIHVIVKTDDKEEDSDGAGVVLHKHPKSEEHGEASSDTDNSEDWPSSAVRFTPQTHSEGNKEDADRTEECCSSDSEWSWEFNSPTKTPARTKRKMEDPDQSPQIKEHKCSECGKVFPHSVRLRKHQLSHMAKCPVCAKEYTEIRILRVHMRTHTGEKPFKCSICSKRFAFKYALNQHMKTHTGEKPFKCSVCQKDFRTESDLKRHMRTHTGERPFKCPVCVKDYADKRYLIRHMRTHTEEGPSK